MVVLLINHSVTLNEYGGFLNWGYPQITQNKNHFSIEPMVLESPQFKEPHIITIIIVKLYYNVLYIQYTVPLLPNLKILIQVNINQSTSQFPIKKKIPV